MSSYFLDKDIIYVSSKKRISGTSEDFIFDFSRQVTGNNYDTITLLNFSCPKSYYLFNNTNNKFKLDENGAISDITITPGNYNSSTMITELKTVLNGHAYTYNVTLNQKTGKLSFSVTGNGGIQPILDFSNSLGCEEILGFDNDQYQFAANILISPNTINLQLTQSISLMSNLVANNVLANIVPNSADYGYILYNEYNPVFSSHRLASSGNNINNSRFWLIDSNTSNKIELNGQEFNFSFAIYKSNEYYKKTLESKKIESLIEELANGEQSAENDNTNEG